MTLTMTIDEVIEHCKRTVEFESKYIMKGRRGGGKVEYSKRYLEHKLVAEWLEELKKYREMNIVHCKDCKHWGTGVAGEIENVKCCEYGGYMVGENGYCGYGEKE